jgi:hypothetical protein
MDLVSVFCRLLASFPAASVSLCVLDLFSGLISSWFSFGCSYVSRNLFLLDFPIYLNISSQTVSDDSLDFLGVCVNHLFFVSDFTNLGLFPPHVSQIWRSLSIFFIFSKTLLFVSVILCMVFVCVCVYFIDFGPYYFSPACFGFSLFLFF